jgi:hypothetical protein
VDRIKSQELERAFRAIRRAVDEPVAFGLERRFADDVVFRDDVAFVADQKAGPDAGLTLLSLEQRDLQQLPAPSATLRGRQTTAGWDSGGSCTGG